MATISISLSHGTDGFRPSDFTTGVLAPGAGDTEVRFNTVDTASNPISRNDTIKHLMAIIRAAREQHVHRDDARPVGGASMSSRILEGTTAHIAACLSALQTLQSALPAAIASGQASVNQQYIIYYRSIVASCKSNNDGAGAGPPFDALRTLGVNS